VTVSSQGVEPKKRRRNMWLTKLW